MPGARCSTSAARKPGPNWHGRGCALQRGWQTRRKPSRERGMAFLGGMIFEQDFEHPGQRCHIRQGYRQQDLLDVGLDGPLGFAFVLREPGQRENLRTVHAEGLERCGNLSGGIDGQRASEPLFLIIGIALVEWCSERGGEGTHRKARAGAQRAEAFVGAEHDCPRWLEARISKF